MSPRRIWLVLFSCVAVVAVPALTGLQQAHAAVSAVTGVTVHGHGTTAATVDIGWTAPSDPAYAGARVVVVAGATPPTSPTDPAAVFTVDATPPTTSVAFGPGTDGQRYAVGIFAYTSGASEFAPAATSTWLTPAPVSGLKTWLYDASIAVDWSRATGYDYLACVVQGSTPPAEPVSGCQTQFAPLTNGERYSFSVFSKDRTTNEWSTPVSRTLVLDPPPDVQLIRTAGVDAHSLHVQWHTGQEYRGIVAQMAEGLQPPASSSTPVVDAQFPIESLQTATVTGLKANTPYTFVVRNRLSGGYLTQAAATTTAVTHTPGAGLATDNSAASSWTNTRPPKATRPQAAYAVAPDGTLYALYGAGTGNLVRIYFASRSPAGRWSAPVQLGTSVHHPEPPAGFNAHTQPLFLDRSPGGQLAAVFYRGDPATKAGWVYRIRPARSTTWGLAHTLSQNVMGMAQDRRGRLHLLTFAGGYARQVYYRTSTAGWWSAQALSARPQYPPSGNALAYDPVKDRIVIAVGTWDAHHMPGVLIGSTSATARRFARTTVNWNLAGSLWPTSVSAYNGQIGIGLRPVKGPGRPWLLRGTSPTTMRGAVPVWRTSASDGAPIVTSNAGGIYLSWARSSTNITSTQQGVFTSYYRYVAALHRWAFTSPLQRATGHYDQPAGLFTDNKHHTYVGYWIDF